MVGRGLVYAYAMLQLCVYQTSVVWSALFLYVVFITHCRDTDDASVHFTRSLFSWWLVAIEGGVFFASLLLTVFVYNLITIATVS